MIKVFPISKFRTQLGSIIKRVRINKERFIIEKDGYPVAGILDIDEFEDYIDAKNSPMIIAESKADYKVGKVKDARKVLQKIKKNI